LRCIIHSPDLPATRWPNNPGDKTAQPLVRIAEVLILQIGHVVESVLVHVLSTRELGITARVPPGQDKAHGEDDDDERDVEGEVDVKRVEVSGFPNLLEDCPCQLR
jgi:hypothetical protein